MSHELRATIRLKAPVSNLDVPRSRAPTPTCARSSRAAKSEAESLGLDIEIDAPRLVGVRAPKG